MGGFQARSFPIWTRLSRLVLYTQWTAKGASGKGPRPKTSKKTKSVKNIFDTIQHFWRRAKNVKNRQKVSKIFSTLFDNFRAAPVFRPLSGGSDILFGTLLMFWSLSLFFEDFPDLFFFSFSTRACVGSPKGVVLIRGVFPKFHLVMQLRVEKFSPKFCSAAANHYLTWGTWEDKSPPHHMMLSFCCFCTRDFRALLVRLGGGSLLAIFAIVIANFNHSLEVTGHKSAAISDAFVNNEHCELKVRTRSAECPCDLTLCEGKLLRVCFANLVRSIPSECRYGPSHLKLHVWDGRLVCSRLCHSY